MRIGYIDALKGIAIILVVLGHMIQYVFCPNDYSDNIIFRYIYSFHMGFFMALSGFTVRTYHDSFQSVLRQIDKRAVNLILPFISWALLGYYLMDGVDLPTVFKRTDCGLWFLYALFVIYTIFQLAIFPVRNCKKAIRYFVLGIAYLMLHEVTAKHLLPIETYWALAHFPNFCLGYIIADNKEIILKRSNFKLLLLTIPLYFLLATLWRQTLTESILTKIASSWVYGSIIVLLTTLSFFWLAMRFEKTLKAFKLEIIGRLTLGIYAIHQPLIGLREYLPDSCFFFFANYILGGAILFTIVMVVSIIFVRLLSTTKFTSILFLGKY